MQTLFLSCEMRSFIFCSVKNEVIRKAAEPLVQVCTIGHQRKGRDVSHWCEGTCNIALPTPGWWVFTHAAEYLVQFFQEIPLSDFLSLQIESKF